MLHDDAWVREGGRPAAVAGVEFLPDNQRIWFLSERDGWMHLYTLDVGGADAQAEAADVGQVGDHGRGAVARRQEVLPHDHRSPSRASGISTSLPVDGGARTQDHVDDRLERGGRLARRIDARRWSTPTATSRPRCIVMPNTAGRAGEAGHDDADRRSGGRSSGSIRRSSPSRRATASTSTRGCSRRR